jgi:hypothetical protein
MFKVQAVGESSKREKKLEQKEKTAEEAIGQSW